MYPSARVLKYHSFILVSRTISYHSLFEDLKIIEFIRLTQAHKNGTKKYAGT